MLYYEEKNVLITITENLALTQHAVMPEGETKEIMKVRAIDWDVKPQIKSNQKKKKDFKKTLRLISQP